MNLRAVLKQGERLLKKHSPEILTGLGLVTLASSVVLAVKATPKALWVIEHEEIEQAHPLSTKEKVKAAGKLYIPAAVAFAAGSACIIGASSIHLHRNAALAAAASLTDATFKSYREVVSEKIGEKAEKDIHKPRKIFTRKSQPKRWKNIPLRPKLSIFRTETTPLGAMILLWIDISGPRGT